MHLNNPGVKKIIMKIQNNLKLIKILTPKNCGLLLMPYLDRNVYSLKCTN